MLNCLRKSKILRWLGASTKWVALVHVPAHTSVPAFDVAAQAYQWKQAIVTITRVTDAKVAQL